MAREQWEKQAKESLTGETVANLRPEAIQEQIARICTLLARQHAAVRDKVRMIRNRATLSQFQTIRETLVYRQACNDLLAALAMHRKGRT